MELFKILIFIGIIIVSVLSGIYFVRFFFDLRKRKYREFILNNSLALQKLLALNKNYYFYECKNYDESYTYDNENFYIDISCQDYLIYLLSYKAHDVLKDIKNVEKNKLNYINYSNRLDKINLGNFSIATEKLNLKYLFTLEKQIFNKMKLKPVLFFKIKISLYCSTINGFVYDSKSEIFNAKQIEILIQRLNNKNGYFYNDKEIWDALCKVERGKVSNKMRFSIYKRDGYRCCKCGRTDNFVSLEIDHIKPIAKGGKSTYENLQTLCHDCNRAKGSKY